MKASTWKWLAVVAALYALLVLYTVGPLLGAFAAGWIGEACGCIVHEGFSNPCVVLGVDIGGWLHGAFVGGWFSLFTIPTGLFALQVFTVILVVIWLLRQFSLWWRAYASPNRESSSLPR